MTIKQFFDVAALGLAALALLVLAVYQLSVSQEEAYKQCGRIHSLHVCQHILR